MATVDSSKSKVANDWREAAKSLERKILRLEKKTAENRRQLAKWYAEFKQNEYHKALGFDTFHSWAESHGMTVQHVGKLARLGNCSAIREQDWRHGIDVLDNVRREYESRKSTGMQVIAAQSSIHDDIDATNEQGNLRRGAKLVAHLKRQTKTLQDVEKTGEQVLRETIKALQDQIVAEEKRHQTTMRRLRKELSTAQAQLNPHGLDENGEKVDTATGQILREVQINGG